MKKLLLCAIALAGFAAFASPPLGACNACHSDGRQSTSFVTEGYNLNTAFPDPGRVVSDHTFHLVSALSMSAGVNPKKNHGIAFDVGKSAVLIAIGTEENIGDVARGFVNIPFDVGKTGAATAASGDLGVDGWVYDIHDVRQDRQVVTQFVTG